MSDRIAKKLLIVGWDAADWAIIDQLFAHGEMPNLRRLVAHGTRADLATLDPKLSPLLWTSIATGKTADKHGILNFVEPDPMGSGLRVSSSTSRKTKALWNILSQSGMRSNVVSWYASHPAEPIRGVCVSNLFQEGMPASPTDPWPMMSGAVHPVAIEPQIAKARIHSARLSRDTLRALVPRLAEIDPGDERLATMSRLSSQCFSVHEAAMAILRQPEAWDCTMVFYDTIDTIGHHFMQYRPPRMQHVSTRDFELFREVMDRLYKQHDSMLGALLKAAGPETTVIVLSDHGFFSDHMRPVTQHLSNQQRAEIESSWHRPLGVLTMSGPGIKRGQVLYGTSILDVVPTSLALLGLPIGLDMDGRVLTEAFDRPVTAATLFSWDMHPGEAGMHPADLRQDPFDSQAAIQQLVELGYMAAMPEDSKAKIEMARRESTFNLAVVYLTTGKLDKAIPLFEELNQRHPDERRYLLGLTQCLFACLRFNECVTVLRQYLARNPSNVEARLQLAGTLAADDRRHEAEEEFARIEREHGGRHDLATAFGDVCSALLRWSDAERFYRKALELNPTNAAACFGAARAAMGQESFDDAVEYALRAVETQHLFPEAHHLLGVALTWTKDYDHAIQSFLIAVSMQPGLLDSHRYLASIYRHLGDRESAAKHRVLAEKLINAKATGSIGIEFLKREAPMGPQEWAKRMGLDSDLAPLNDSGSP